MFLASAFRARVERRKICERRFEEFFSFQRATASSSLFKGIIGKWMGRELRHRRQHDNHSPIPSFSMENFLHNNFSDHIQSWVGSLNLSGASSAIFFTLVCHSLQQLSPTPHLHITHHVTHQMKIVFPRHLTYLHLPLFCNCYPWQRTTKPLQFPQDSLDFYFHHNIPEEQFTATAEHRLLLSHVRLEDDLSFYDYPWSCFITLEYPFGNLSYSLVLPSTP